MLTLELLRIFCAAPEKHTHHDGQEKTRRTAQRDCAVDGVKEEKVEDQEREQLMERDDRKAGWWV